MLKESAINAVSEMNGYVHRGKDLLVEFSSDNPEAKELNAVVRDKSEFNLSFSLSSLLLLLVLLLLILLFKWNQSTLYGEENFPCFLL